MIARESDVPSPGLKPLDEAAPGETVQIVSHRGCGRMKGRMLSMGLTKGADVTILQNGGCGPVLIGVRGSRFALGRGMAKRIWVNG